MAPGKALVFPVLVRPLLHPTETSGVRNTAGSINVRLCVYFVLLNRPKVFEHCLVILEGAAITYDAITGVGSGGYAGDLIPQLCGGYS